VRISTSMIGARVLSQIASSQRRLAETQEAVGSGLRIRRPADDPFGTSQVMASRTRLELSEQFQRTIVVARNELGSTEDSLAALGSVLLRAQELAVQGANGTLGAGDRQKIALEIAQLLDQSIAIGNTRQGGRFIFSGHQSSTQAFVPDFAQNPTVVTYQGDTGQIRHEIGERERVTTNIVGSDVFPQLFATLITLRDNLQGNDQQALGLDADQVAARLDEVLQQRAKLGAGMRRVEMVETRLADRELRLRTEISGLEDADLAEAIAELQTRETAFQAALGAAGRSLSLSLLDFLR
jgi:flagellar hook-associated protein 3 FlgL